MPPVPEALRGVWAKLDWANEQLRKMERHEFDASKYHAKFIVKEDDPKAGCYIYRLTRDPEIPPGFSVLMGSIAHTLRSALDHLAYALCGAYPIAPKLPERIARSIEFPVCAGNANDYNALRVRGVVRSLAKPGAIDAIDEIHPYKGGPGQALSFVHDLDRTDKHRLLLTVAYCTPIRDITNAEAFSRDVSYNRHVIHEANKLVRMLSGGMFAMPRAQPLKAGDVVFRLPHAEANKDVNLVLRVAINEQQIMPVEPAIEFFHDTTNLIRRIVPRFDTFV